MGRWTTRTGVCRLFVALGIAIGAVAAGCGAGDGSSSEVQSTGARLVVPAQETILHVSDPAAGDKLGTSVAVDGDTAIVGASEKSYSGYPQAGQAYVFVRKCGAWHQQAILRASNGPAYYSRFGTSVAVDGDTAIVGEPLRSYGGMTAAGQAVVFVRRGRAWKPRAILRASDPAAYDAVGYAVAINGHTAMVGAHSKEYQGMSKAGRVYVYRRYGQVWKQKQILHASDAGVNDLFGYSISMDGHTTVMSAPGKDYSGMVDAGEGYVFVHRHGRWVEQAILRPTDAGAYRYFGNSIAIDGETVAVGNESTNFSGLILPGQAYVFARHGRRWKQQAILRASDAAEHDRFGRAVAVGDNLVLVGAPRDVEKALTWPGQAYLFAGHGHNWTEQAILTASDAAPNDNFGVNVAVQGDAAVIGAWLRSYPGLAMAGSAYAYELESAPGHPHWLGEHEAHGCKHLRPRHDVRW